MNWRTPSAQEAGAKIETLYTKDGQPARPGERAYRLQPNGELVLQSQTINQQVDMVEKAQVTKNPAESQTPKTGDCKATIHFPKREGGGQPNLAYDVEKNGWRTPNVCDVTGGSKSADGVLANNGMLKLQDQVKTPSKKLNPRWVETLMGVPFGWVSPFPVEEETNTNRVDELRLLGNGVVPGTALKAFITLKEQNQSTTP